MDPRHPAALSHRRAAHQVRVRAPAQRADRTADGGAGQPPAADDTHTVSGHRARPVNPSMDRSIDCSIDRSIHCWIHCSIHCSIDRRIDRRIHRRIHRRIGYRNLTVESSLMDDTHTVTGIGRGLSIVVLISGLTIGLTVGLNTGRTIGLTIGFAVGLTISLII